MAGGDGKRGEGALRQHATMKKTTTEAFFNVTISRKASRFSVNTLLVCGIRGYRHLSQLQRHRERSPPGRAEVPGVGDIFAPLFLECGTFSEILQSQPPHVRMLTQEAKDECSWARPKHTFSCSWQKPHNRHCLTGTSDAYDFMPIKSYEVMQNAPASAMQLALKLPSLVLLPGHVP